MSLHQTKSIFSICSYVADGSPKWSVDDDAMPLAFFDPKTGEFEDSTQARVRSKLMVNFGNPYKEKRADSLIPEKFLSQTPSLRQGGFGSTSTGNLWMSPSPTSSDSFDSVEEGEAIFVLNLPSKRSPKREEADTPLPPEILPAKRPRSDSDDTMDSVSSTSVGSESKKSQAPVIPPPPRPRPPAPKSKLATKSSKLPPPPPSRPKSGVPPPPPPLAAVKKVPPLIQPIKIQPPPPKPPKSELAVSSCEAASSSSSTGGFELTQSLDPTEESGTALSNDEPSLKPSVGEEDALATVSHAIAAIASVKTDILVLDDESNKPDVALPTGWMCVWSKSQKRWYFFDTKTNKSVWNWPP